QGQRKSTLVRLANLHGFDELLTKMAAALPPPPPVPDAPKPAEGSEPPAEGSNKEGEQGRGRPSHGAEPATAIPPAVAQLYEARHGYANYQPNRLKQQELVTALRRQFPQAAHADGEDASNTANTTWRVEGGSDDDAAT